MVLVFFFFPLCVIVCVSSVLVFVSGVTLLSAHIDPCALCGLVSILYFAHFNVSLSLSVSHPLSLYCLGRKDKAPVINGPTFN